MPIEIFCCYARKDQSLLSELKEQLNPLQRQGLITIWADTEIDAGLEWQKEIDKHLDSAQIILLLVSPAFMGSEYCYSNEMQKAIARHNHGEARVIPVILRPVIWQHSPFGKIQAIPTNGEPVISAFWHSTDEAFFTVAKGISRVVERLIANQPHPVQKVPLKVPTLEPAGETETITLNFKSQKGDDPKTLYQLFFADLLERLKTARPGVTNAKKTQQQPFWWFSAGKTGFYFQWAFSRQGLRTELSINIPKKRDATKKAFDTLWEQWADIEEEFGQSLVWNRSEGIESSITMLRQAAITDPPDELERTKIWAVETMLKFVDVFQKRIKTL